MTRPDAKPRDDAALPSGFRELCRETGIKSTHQRLEIFLALEGLEGHPSAEEVFSIVRKRIPTISLDTVYRTLATFVKAGMLSRIEQHGRARFDTNRRPHHHFVCNSCGRIVDFDWPAMDRLAPPGKAKGLGRIESRYAELRGTCAACRGKKKAPA